MASQEKMRYLLFHRIRDTTEVIVPLPPLEVQRRLMDALQDRVERLVKLQSETAAQLDALLPSILDRAFRGEL